MLYYANDKYGGALSSGYTTGETTLYVTAVPTNVPTVIVADKGGANETVFKVTGKTVNSLTGVSRIRGANVNLDPGTVLTCLNNEDFINQFISISAWYDKTYGASINFDLDDGTKQRVTLTGNSTLSVSNSSDGKVFMIRLTQDATGSRTVTWWSGISWDDGVAPTLTTTANKTDVFAFVATGASTYDGYVLGQNK